MSIKTTESKEEYSYQFSKGSPETRPDVTAKWIFLNDETTKKVRIHFRHFFHWYHVICCVALTITLISIIVYGANGTFDAKTHWTYAPLERDTLPSPPKKLFTNFKIIHTAHLAITAAFIPFFALLYFLVLVLPFPLSSLIMTCFCMRKRIRGLTKVEPLDPTDTAYKRFSNVYLVWFDHNLLTGHAGLKYTFFAFSSAFLTVLVAQVVGITEFFSLFMIWVYPFFGTLILWHYEFTAGDAVAQAREIARSASRRGGVSEKVEGQESVSQFGFSERTSPMIDQESPSVFSDLSGNVLALDNNIQAFVERLQEINLSYMPVTVAMLMVLIPFAQITTYFAEMVSEDSGNVQAYVYVSFIYFVFMVAANLTVFLLHHINFVIMKNFFVTEFIVTTIHVIGYILIPITVLAQTRDDGTIYGIALVP